MKRLAESVLIGRVDRTNESHGTDEFIFIVKSEHALVIAARENRRHGIGVYAPVLNDYLL